MTERERWRPIPGWEGAYSVSSHGRVRGEARLLRNPWGNRHLRQRIIHPTPDRSGAPVVRLYRGGRTTSIRVGRLVASVFPPEPAATLLPDIALPSFASFYACHDPAFRLAA